MAMERELTSKLREIIPDDECNTHLRDNHWIPEIISLFRSYARSLIPKSVKVRKLDSEDVYDYAHRVFQETREEMLNRINYH
ncbi:hypothetical protein DRO91_09945 [Candidatus Heimdallarchaeota archaeon]|nr:MAG: hypothetical protein DRO91_09945 [Candidatus Heimdallarchaeota archaeon]